MAAVDSVPKTAQEQENFALFNLENWRQNTNMYIPITKARDLPKENKFSGFEIIRYLGSLMFGKGK